MRPLRSRRAVRSRETYPPLAETSRTRRSWFLLGNCFRACRTVDGQNAERRRGVRGSGGSEGCRKDEWGCPSSAGRRISEAEFLSRRDSLALSLFSSLIFRSALPSSFWRWYLRGADPWPQSRSRTRMEPSSRGLRLACGIPCAGRKGRSLDPHRHFILSWIGTSMNCAHSRNCVTACAPEISG